MTRYDLAALVLACSAALGAVWFAFTRNGHRLVYVTAVAVHRLLLPATGTHVREEEEPDTVRAVLRDIALAAAASVRTCLAWPAGQMPRPETPRVPAAASAPGEGTALETPASGAAPPVPRGLWPAWDDGAWRPGAETRSDLPAVPVDAARPHGPENEYDGTLIDGTGPLPQVIA